MHNTIICPILCPLFLFQDWSEVQILSQIILYDYPVVEDWILLPPNLIRPVHNKSQILNIFYICDLVSCSEGEHREDSRVRSVLIISHAVAIIANGSHVGKGQSVQLRLQGIHSIFTLSP